MVNLTTEGLFEFLNANALRMETLSRFFWGSKPAELSDSLLDITPDFGYDTTEARGQVLSWTSPSNFVARLLISLLFGTERKRTSRTERTIIRYFKNCCQYIFFQLLPMCFCRCFSWLYPKRKFHNAPNTVHIAVWWIAFDLHGPRSALHEKTWFNSLT